MSVSKSENENDAEIRGWFGTLSDKMEKMERLMGYEQDDSEKFLEIIDDLEEIIIDIKDYFETKYYPVPRSGTPPHEEIKNEK